jgi:NodT family efflux transporter outer membrane factor (OMF) lipoprotein
MQRATRLSRAALLTAVIFASASGCTSPGDYIRNGFKVGPNCGVPQGPTAPQWIDAADVRVRPESEDPNGWWTVFNDPTLDSLIANASAQNLSLREAGFRVLAARAQLGIAGGNLFPQSQSAFGGYQREAYSRVANSSQGFGTQFFDQQTFGFNLAWELDFWGRFRRAVTAAEDTLGASCANYDDVQVTLLGDVASNYVQFRTLQQRIEYVRANVELQAKILGVAERRVKAGAKGALDLHQARSNLAQTEAQVPQLRMALRQAGNRLCVLMGVPPADLEQQLGPGPIPAAPGSVATGIPAELLQRRPDVRRAELQAAAQAEQIGIAEADFYPMIAINGTIGYLSQDISQLFTQPALTGAVGPLFQWKILNYGRIRNNMKQQEAAFQAMVAAYQQTVLKANAEVEDGLATFLRAQERAALLESSVAHSKEAVELVGKEYQGGAADFNRVATIELNLVQQQDLQAQARGEIAQGLIRIYRALGGGWPAEVAAAETPLSPPAPELKPGEPVPTPGAPPPASDPEGVVRLKGNRTATGFPNRISSTEATSPPPASQPEGVVRRKGNRTATDLPNRISSTEATPVRPVAAGAIPSKPLPPSAPREEAPRLQSDRRSERTPGRTSDSSKSAGVPLSRG